MPSVTPFRVARRFAGANAAAPDSCVGSMNSIAIALPSGLAVDAGADRHRHRAALVAVPGRDHRAGAARRAHEHVVARLEGGVLALAALADHRALAAVGPLAAAHARLALEVLAHVRLGPAGALEVRAQLRRNDDRVVARPDRVVAHAGADLRGVGVEDLLGRGGPLVHELARRSG